MPRGASLQTLARPSVRGEPVSRSAMPAAPSARATTSSQSHGRGGADNATSIRGAIKISWRARMRTPSSIATSLRSRPARRLLAVECGRLARPPAPGGSVHCKRRAGSARPCGSRVIGPRRGELLRALNRPEARASGNEPGRRPSRKLARGRGARCRSCHRCERRVRERSAEAWVRAVSAWRAACLSTSWSRTTPARPSRRARRSGRSRPSRNDAAIARELAAALELARDGGLHCRSRREATRLARGAPRSSCPCAPRDSAWPRARSRSAVRPRAEQSCRQRTLRAREVRRGLACLRGTCRSWPGAPGDRGGGACRSSRGA